MIERISAVMITKNSQRHLKESLQSLRDFKEVVLYDNGSSDETIKIAKSFANVKIIQGEFLGFGPTKNRAAEYASNDWIFSIDSDEVATKELIEELSNLPLHENSVYAIDRQNLFLNEPVRHSGWSPDWVKRIYNKKVTKFNENSVHESIEAKNVTKLQGRLIHYAVDEVTDFLVKTSRYAKLARQNQKKLTPYQAFWRALFAFFKTYLLKRGFLDGYAGLIIAIGNFNGVFFKYCYRFYHGSAD